MKNIICLGLLLISFQTTAQQLQRSGAFGFVPVDVDKTVAEYLGLEDSSGALIQKVLPNSTSEALGLKPKDVVLEVNKQKVTEAKTLYVISQNLKAGEKLTIKVNRNKEIITLKGLVKAREVFTPENTEIILGETEFRDGLLRYSIQKPEGEGPFPLIFYLQGYTCGSCIDVPPHHPYARTANEFASKGYAVLKIEKPGVGDSETKEQCENIDFDTEVEGFKTSKAILEQYDFIDKARITVFGHSMGGLIAPIIANHIEATSIIFYGVGFQPWQDYSELRLRHQLPWYGYDYVEIESKSALIKTVFHKFFIEKMPPKAILEEDPSYMEVLQAGLQYDGNEHMFGRHYTFWQNLNDKNLIAPFKTYQGRVLGVFGESDIAVISGEEAERAIAVVNSYHPGQGEFWSIPDTNHHIISIDKPTNIQVQSTPNYTQYLMSKYNVDLIQSMDEWINKKQ